MKTKPNPSLESLRFPRTQREAGWSPHAEWDDKSPTAGGLVSAIVSGLVRALLLWVFFAVVLSLGK